VIVCKNDLVLLLCAVKDHPICTARRVHDSHCHENLCIAIICDMPFGCPLSIVHVYFFVFLIILFVNMFENIDKVA